MKIFVPLIFIFILYSCTDKVSKTLIGTWTFDSQEKSNEYIFNNFYSNMISFDKANVCYLPKPRNNNNGKEGNWFISKEGEVQYITIDVKNNSLSGKYSFKFERDSINMLLKLHLTSDSMRFICSKMLHNFDD